MKKIIFIVLSTLLTVSVTNAQEICGMGGSAMEKDGKCVITENTCQTDKLRNEGWTPTTSGSCEKPSSCNPTSLKATIHNLGAAGADTAFVNAALFGWPKPVYFVTGRCSNSTDYDYEIFTTISKNTSKETRVNLLNVIKAKRDDSSASGYIIIENIDLPLSEVE